MKHICKAVSAIKNRLPFIRPLRKLWL